MNDGAVSEHRVTELYERPRRPGRFVIGLDHGPSFTVSAGALADAGATRIGAVVSGAVLAHLERESCIIATMDRALASLARGRRSRRELEIRLKRHETDPLIVMLALDRLYASGITSDEAMAHAEAAARLRRGESPLRVQQQLRRKGIDGGLAAHAVRTVVHDDEIDEDALCRTAAERRVRSLQSLEPSVARRRLTAFLRRRGFGMNAIMSAVGAHFDSR